MPIIVVASIDRLSHPRSREGNPKMSLVLQDAGSRWVKGTLGRRGELWVETRQASEAFLGR